MSMREAAGTEPEIGSRVHVWRGDQTKDLGYGTYMGDVPCDTISQEEVERIEGFLGPSDSEPADPHLANEAYLFMIETRQPVAKIVLESGETIYGHLCWWEFVEGERRGKPN